MGFILENSHRKCFICPCSVAKENNALYIWAPFDPELDECTYHPEHERVNGRCGKNDKVFISFK